MSGTYSRNKGHNFERFIAKTFREHYPESCRNYENLPNAELGHDVIAGPYLIQCKRGKGYAPLNKIFEVSSNKGIPVLISKADNKPEMVCLNLEAFMEMVKKCKVYDEIKHIRGREPQGVTDGITT